MDFFLQQLVNGLGLGAIYALIAVGYTMVYGILGLINFAHGDVFMLAPVIVLSVYLPLMLFGLPANWMVAVAAVVIAALFCGAMGFLIERTAYRPLRQPYSVRTAALVAFGLPAALMVLSLAIPGKLPVRSGNPSELTVVYRNAGDAPPTPAQAATLPPVMSAEAAQAKNAEHWRTVLRVLAVLTLLYGLGLFANRAAFRAGVGRADRLTALITAIGISLFLEYFLQQEQVFGNRKKEFPGAMFEFPGHAPVDSYSGVGTPDPASSRYRMGGVAVQGLDVLVLGVLTVLMLGLTYVVKYTRLGTAMRAVSYNHDSARLMGIDVNKIIGFTFILGSVLAGVGGLLYASIYKDVGPLMGVQPGTKAFVAAVLGGIGSIPGAVLGGLLMGISEVLVASVSFEARGGTLLGAVFGVADGEVRNVELSAYKDAVAFLVLILILLFRPAGLLGRNVPEKV